ncbi:hypothetical protein [Streptomyces sp. NPDC001508]
MRDAIATPEGDRIRWVELPGQDLSCTPPLAPFRPPHREHPGQGRSF